MLEDDAALDSSEIEEHFSSGLGLASERSGWRAQRSGNKV